MKSLITNKVAFLVILLTLLWCVADSRTRLLINNNNTQIKTTGFTAVALTLPQPSEQLIAKLNVAYQKYHQKINNDIIREQGLSEAEQAKQHGVLKKVFIGDLKLELKAVISVLNNPGEDHKGVASLTNKTQYVALIAITNVKSGKQKIKKFSNNSYAYDYLLTINKNTQVVLTKKASEQRQNDKQKIVLQMYQSGK